MLKNMIKFVDNKILRKRRDSVQSCDSQTGSECRDCEESADWRETSSHSTGKPEETETIQYTRSECKRRFERKDQ